MILSTSAVVIGLASVVSAVLSLWAVPQHVKTGDDRIQQLEKMKTSLKDLADYLDGQQRVMREVETSVQKLQEEKQTLESVMTISRSQIAALVDYQASQRSFSLWVERGLSFVIGFFASVAATAVWTYAKRDKRTQVIIEGPTTKTMAR